MVIAERPLLDGEYDYVLMDNFEAAYLATSHLVKRGHRQIAFLTWDARAASLKERLRGYQAALQEQGIPIDRRLSSRSLSPQNQAGA